MSGIEDSGSERAFLDERHECGWRLEVVETVREGNSVHCSNPDCPFAAPAERYVDTGSDRDGGFAEGGDL